MSLAEILEEIPKLSFAERQEVMRRAMAEDAPLTPEEDAMLDEEMADFRRNPDAGIPLEQLQDYMRARLRKK